MSKSDHSCGLACEVYSRVTGYHRPVKNWNEGKREEFKSRKYYSLSKGSPSGKFVVRVQNGTAVLEKV